MALNTRSRENLAGVHPDLVAVMEAAAEKPPVPFTIIEGPRTRARQRELVDEGVSWTMNSRHIPARFDGVDGEVAAAVDVVPDADAAKPGLQLDWDDWGAFRRIARHILDVAEKRGVQIVWGGSWPQRDGPHFELEWHAYPTAKQTPAGERRDTAKKVGAGAAGTGAAGLIAWATENLDQVVDFGRQLSALDPVAVVAAGGAVVAFGVVTLLARRFA